jgi:hypothetical protein
MPEVVITQSDSLQRGPEFCLMSFVSLRVLNVVLHIIVVFILI